MKKTTIADWLIIAAVLMSGIFITIKNLNRTGSIVRVQAAGTEYEYSLSREGIYTVEGAAGKTTFRIHEGKVCITDSACPNKICVHSGFSNPIVCMPNDVIITIEKSSGELDFDACSE